MFIFVLHLLVLLVWDMGTVRHRFGGTVRFKLGLMCKGRANNVIIYVITEINYRYNYMQVFLKYKYNVKTYVHKVHCIKWLIEMLVHNSPAAFVISYMRTDQINQIEQKEKKYILKLYNLSTRCKFASMCRVPVY